MRLSFLGLTLLCFGLTLAQDEKRLRFRRPRPFKDIDNVDGIAKGRPVPIKIGRADPSHLLASAFEGQETQQRSQQANAALESLLATAGRGSADRGSPPQEAIFEEVAFNQRAQIPRQQQRNPPVQRQEQEEVARRPQSRPRGRTRLPPQVPRRKPSEDNGAPKKFKPRKPSVKTTERYSHENEDGSFTFGYVSEDGSFREETRGVDCITRGKYGYIDPEGKKREFTYVSGLPCDTPENGLATEDEDSLQRVVQDPVNPAERFRTSNPVQLSEEDLPSSFIRNRQRVRRPQSGASAVRQSSSSSASASSGAQEFPSFNRGRVRPPTQAPTRRPLASSGALNNLFAIADDKPTEQLAPRRPVTPVTRRPPTPTPSRAPPTPTARPSPTPSPTRRPSPTPSRQPSSPTPSRRPPPPTQANFNFKSTLANFENRRPAITFDGRAQQQNAQKSKPVGPNFSSEFSFNPESGTFQTELRQNFGGQEELRLSQPNAPSGHNNQAFASTTASTPFASFSTTAATTRSRPRPTPTASAGRSPSLSFRPLEFPDPSTVKLPEPPAASPEKSVFFQPFPSSTAAPPPPTPKQATLTSFPATPTATPVRTLPPSPPNRPPPQAGRPPVRPQAGRPPPPPQAGRPPPPPQAGRPPFPPPPQPFNPNSQFAFNPPPPQGGSRARPFTAFSNGTPPQLSFGAPPGVPQQFQQRPGSFQSFPQQQRATSFPAPQFQQQQPGARFLGAGRPTPPPQQSPAASAPFAVFNPAAFAGVRGA